MAPRLNNAELLNQTSRNFPFHQYLWKVDKNAQKKKT